MHPFVEDYLGNSVMDYAALHKEEKNPNVCDGIKMAQDQWRLQMDENAIKTRTPQSDPSSIFEHFAPAL